VGTAGVYIHTVESRLREARHQIDILWDRIHEDAIVLPTDGRVVPLSPGVSAKLEVE
jgi:hypothetical protein